MEVHPQQHSGMDPIAIGGLIIYEIISLILIYRLWTARRRRKILQRCFLSVILLAPVLGWLLYGFVVISPDEHADELPERWEGDGRADS
jgi:hypothetical protein